jgi:hypothetical protein
MAEPTHYVLLVREEDDVEVRRLGPMHLGRAHLVEKKLASHPDNVGHRIEVVINEELDDADTDPEGGREDHDR